MTLFYNVVVPPRKVKSPTWIWLLASQSILFGSTLTRFEGFKGRYKKKIGICPALVSRGVL